MSLIDRDDPRAVVLAFADAYTKWEIDMDAAENGLYDPILQKRCDTIIYDFCTHKKRSYVDGLYSYGIPPTYALVVDENIVNVEAVTRSRTHVDTKLLRSHAYRFVLLKKKDGWRIDSVKWRFSDHKEWENTLIGS